MSRWVLERDAAAVPAIGGSLRKHAFEVSVVDEFHRLAQRWFERAKLASVWERPFLTGSRGKPLAVDIALFDETNKTETRLEFGAYTKTKLRDDAQKLVSLHAMSIPGFAKVENFVILWEEHADRENTRENLEEASRRFSADAKWVTKASVHHRVTTCVDLFATTTGKAHTALIGVFEIKPLP